MNENRCGGCHAADRPCEKCELRAENARLKKMLDAANALIGESADETTRLTEQVWVLKDVLREIANWRDNCHPLNTDFDRIGVHVDSALQESTEMHLQMIEAFAAEFLAGAEEHNARILAALSPATKGMESTELPRRMRAPRSIDIPGWSVGHQPELGAEAAVRTAPGGQIFVMTSIDDRARSLDEEVTVGLYDWDGEEWEQVGYADFPTVSAVLRLSNDALEKAILDAS